ncbi:MAG: hypothetical protein GY788_01425 [bacterium]|nr:hypothetical protein [bacterium]
MHRLDDRCADPASLRTAAGRPKFRRLNDDFGELWSRFDVREPPSLRSVCTGSAETAPQPSEMPQVLPTRSAVEEGEEPAA